MNSKEILEYIFGGGILLVVFIFIILIVFALIRGSVSKIKSFLYHRKQKVKNLRSEARKKAINKIIDARKKEISEINDQKLLADIAQNAKSIQDRKLAIEKLDDQNILIKILKTDKDVSVCIAAVGKIKNDHILADISKHGGIAITEVGPSLKIREAISNKVKDKTLLRLRSSLKREEYVPDFHDRTRHLLAADNHKVKTIGKMKDQNKLKNIVENDSDHSMRTMALYRIIDENILRAISKNGTLDEATRRQAFNRLKNCESKKRAPRKWD